MWLLLASQLSVARAGLCSVDGNTLRALAERQNWQKGFCQTLFGLAKPLKHRANPF